MEWCERKCNPTGPEYVNAFTSLCLSFSGLLILKESYLFGVCLICIGIGSVLFHYYGTDESRYLDEFPILMYALVYFITIARIPWKKILVFSLVGLFSMVFIPKYNCIFLISTCLYGTYIIPQNISFSFTNRLLLISSLIAWSLDFIQCPIDNMFLPRLTTTVTFTWHSIWHILISLTSYFGSLEFIRGHRKNIPNTK
jgi:hypothetical protein